jgi:hypothetical protein
VRYIVHSLRVVKSLGAAAGDLIDFFGAPALIYWYAT